MLRPGGVIAFATWPPEVMVGQFFALLARYAPAPTPGSSSPLAWGEPSVIRERFGNQVRDLVFDRHQMKFQTLSVQHQRLFFERNIGPLQVLVSKLSATDPGQLAELRAKLEELIARYFEDNHLRQDFLLSRAVKR